MVIGDLSLGLFELEYMTLREIFISHEAYIERLDFQKKLTFNAARMQSWLIINSTRQRARVIKRQEDLIRFEWDAKEEKKKMTRKQMLKFQRKHIKLTLN